MCKEWSVKIDHIVEGHIDLAHGLLGAEAAMRDYYVTDPEILQAIRYHIIGYGNMTLLDKITFLSDAIEPFREDYYPMKEMRELAYKNINKAIIVGLTAMRETDGARGKELHHWSKDAIDALNREEETHD